MDFVADQLAEGRTFRSRAILHIYTRECMAIESEQRLRGQDMVMVFNHIEAPRGVPGTLRCDNGSELSSQAMDLWILPERGTGCLLSPGQADGDFTLHKNETIMSGSTHTQITPDAAMEVITNTTVDGRLLRRPELGDEIFHCVGTR